MTTLSLFAAAWCVAAVLGAQTPAPTPASAAPIGADAAWSPPSDFLARFHSACDALGGPAFNGCFVEQLRKAGASPPALAFARRTGGMGYLREFRETGRVDVAYAEYPFRANENQVCLLVNGEPPWIDVDDGKLLDHEELAADDTYGLILKKYPKTAIFPSDRGGPTRPGVRRFRDGGLEFVVDYVLRDGCHACAWVGTLRFGFRFDGAGKFLGTEIASIRSAHRRS